MRQPVRLVAEAEADLELAIWTYNDRVANLGREFLQQVEATCDRLGEYPAMHQILQSPIRRAVLHRFPFMVIYRTLPDHVEVLGVLPCRADPQSVLERAAKFAGIH